MKSGVALVLLLGVAATLLNPAISAAQEFQVLISGTVTLVSVAGTPVSSGPSLQVSAQALGPSGSLNGHGLDTTFHGNPGGPPPGTCTFRLLTGSVAGTEVTLSGPVSSSTNPANVAGRPSWVTHRPVR